MNLKLYRLLQILITPFVDLYLIYRRIIGKEHKYRFAERLGKSSLPRPGGELVWVHAASIGESVSVIPLLEEIGNKYPDINILITTGTVTSAKLLEKKLPKKIIHQFVPVDMLTNVRRFLKHWQPDVALWVESELWPNLLYETSAGGCPIIMVNARMSSQSLEKWKKHKALAEEIFGCFSMCLAQSEYEAGKFTQAGIANSINAGNLKYESPALYADPAETGKIITAIGKRPVWLAASTSGSEELIVAKVHKKLSEKYPDILTIIVPRHPERSKDISEILRAENLNFTRRSKGEGIENDTQIYLADTIGELGIFYRVSGIVLMGGSLVNHGGQNPLEPARLDCAIVTGPNIYNFKDIYAEMLLNDCVIIIKDENELAEKVDALLSSREFHDRLSTNATHFVQSKTGIINNYMQQLDPYLKPLSKNV